MAWGMKNTWRELCFLGPKFDFLSFKTDVKMIEWWVPKGVSQLLPGSTAGCFIPLLFRAIA